MAKLIIPERYRHRFNGIARLYGEQALTHLYNSHICIIGIGGVGSWIVEALARSGVGQMTLIDMDEICVTNTNRQIHALSRDIGRLKTEVMAERVLQINPDCITHCIDDFINQQNVSEHLGIKTDKKYDYIIDAIDSVGDKAAMLAHCRRNKLKVITVGGAGGQKDPTKIQIKDLAKTIQDQLVAKVRERLKSEYKLTKDSKGKYGIPCVFSLEQLTYPSKNGGVCLAKSQSIGTKSMDCATGFGAVTTVTATFGFVCVSYVLEKLINKNPK